jgi:hypothetical protein
MPLDDVAVRVVVRGFDQDDLESTLGHVATGSLLDAIDEDPITIARKLRKESDLDSCQIHYGIPLHHQGHFDVKMVSSGGDLGRNPHQSLIRVHGHVRGEPIQSRAKPTMGFGGNNKPPKSVCNDIVVRGY